MPTPTFEELKDKLRNWAGVNSGDTQRLPDVVRGDCLNLAMRELLRLHDLSFGEVTDSFVTVGGTRGYAKPTGWSRPHTFWYQHPTSSDLVPLDFWFKEQFDADYPDATVTGDPVAFTVWGEEIQLGPTPSGVVTINRNYQRILPDLADGAPDNENAFTRDAWEVLLFGGLSKAGIFGFEDARVPTWEREFRRLTNHLLIEHARARTSATALTMEEPG